MEHKKIINISPSLPGLGYGMIMVSGIVCIYYNVILAWSFYYMFMAFTGFKTGELPWANCYNPWNTPNCLRRSSYDSAWNVANASAAATTVLPTTSDPQQVSITTGVYYNTTGDAATNNKTTTPSEEFWK